MTPATVSLSSILSAFILSSSIFLQCSQAAPIHCNVSADATIIHDSTCIQEDLRTITRSLGNYYINNELPLSCQPTLAQHSMATKVELLSHIQESAINANYSDIICRMKETVIPFLNQTLSDICTCHTESCDLTTSLLSDVTSSEEESVFSEYCLVDSIERNLVMLLDRIVEDKYVETAIQRRVCRVNIDTRYQLGKIKTEINDLEKELQFEICTGVPELSNLPAECNSVLTRINQLLPQLGEEGHFSLAQEFLLVLPKITEILGTNNAVCLPSDALPVMSEYCNVRLLRSYYLDTYNSLERRLLEDNVILSYIPCPAPEEDMVTYQEVYFEGATLPTPPSAVPPSDTLPERPN